VATVLRVPEGGWPLQSTALALGKTLADDTLRALGGWLDRMVEWNVRIDLTAARSAGELVDLMLTDALVLADNVPAGARVVDVGAGAGAPGLPLGIVRPDLAVTLVEPMAKRTAFLRTVLAAIGRDAASGPPHGPGIRVVASKGEPLAESGASFDVALSRATLPPPEWLALGTRLVKPAGDVWVLLAKEPAPGLDGAECVQTVAYVWPNTGVDRRAVRYVRR
jgi:16S rRNA (guanine527-N7)-methyltransferase